jgi:hypothetical protein
MSVPAVSRVHFRQDRQYFQPTLRDVRDETVNLLSNKPP